MNLCCKATFSESLRIMLDKGVLRTIDQAIFKITSCAPAIILVASDNDWTRAMRIVSTHSIKYSPTFYLI